MGKHDLKIISFNVRGLNNPRKRTAIFKHLQNNSCDIALLQEVCSSKDSEKQWTQEWDGQGIFLHGTKHSKGIAVLIKRGIELEILEKDKDTHNRILFIKIKIQNNIINLFNIYAPNKEIEQIAFINALLGICQRQNIDNTEKCIFGGDWNTVLDTALDKNGGIQSMTKKNYWNRIQDFTQELGIVDIWRIRNGVKKRYTWRQKTPRIQCRLDYFLITDHAQEIVLTSDILPSVLSDHSPISLTLKFLNQPDRGPGYWKLNVSLLQEEEYKLSIRKKLNELKTSLNNMDDKNLKWEMFKYEIRKNSIQYSKDRKRKRNEDKANKEKLMQTLLEQESTQNEDTQNAVNTLKDELDQMYLEEADGAIIRSRAKWHEKGEKKQFILFQLRKTKCHEKRYNKTSNKQ